MNTMPRGKLEELLRQTGFSDGDIEKTHLLSDKPILVLEAASHTTKEVANMWSEIMDGKESSIKEVTTTVYQCLLLGEVLGAKRFVLEPDLQERGWKNEKRLEIAVYRKLGEQRWIKIIILHEPAICDKPDEIFFTIPVSGEELIEIERAAKFLKLLVEEQYKNCRLQFPGA